MLRQCRGDLFYFIGNCVLCGGREFCRRSDPPQAEKLASELLSYLIFQKTDSREIKIVPCESSCGGRELCRRISQV